MWLLGNQVRQSFSQPPVLVISRSERISLSDSRAGMLHYRLLGKRNLGVLYGRACCVMRFHSLRIVIIGCCLLIKFVFFVGRRRKVDNYSHLGSMSSVATPCQILCHVYDACNTHRMQRLLLYSSGCNVCFTTQWMATTPEENGIFTTF